MSTRERWIVYPLLFLCLGIAMRNQFLPTKRMGAVDFMAGELSAQTIRCDNLEVRQDAQCDNNLRFNVATGGRMTTNNSESIHLKALEAEVKQAVLQQLSVTDPQSRPMIIMLAEPVTKSGIIQTMTADGTPQVQIHSNDTGGMVTAIGQKGQVLVGMGHEGNVYGVFAQTSQGGPPSLLTPPKVFQPSPSIPKLSPIPLPKLPSEEKNDEPKKEEAKSTESKSNK